MKNKFFLDYTERHIKIYELLKKENSKYIFELLPYNLDNISINKVINRIMLNFPIMPIFAFEDLYSNLTFQFSEELSILIDFIKGKIFYKHLKYSELENIEKAYIEKIEFQYYIIKNSQKEFYFNLIK